MLPLFFLLLLNSACVKFQINSMHSTVPERPQTLVLPLSLSPFPRLRHPLFFFFPLWSNITLALSKKFSPASKMSGQGSLFIFLSFLHICLLLLLFPHNSAIPYQKEGIKLCIKMTCTADVHGKSQSSSNVPL